MTVYKCIIRELSKGSQGKSTLLKTVMEKTSVTPQAVYKSLRQLIKDGIVVSKSKKVGLTLWYIEGELERWSRVLDTYNHKGTLSDIINLRRGQKLTVIFNTLNELDSYWTQSFSTLERLLPENLPVYMIIPHDWFYYSKPKSDEYWVKKQTRQQRLIITHPLPLDMEIVKNRRNQQFRFTVDKNPLRQDEHQYFSLLSDWVYEIQLDRTVNNKLVSFIERNRQMRTINKTELETIINNKGKFKLTVYHNPKKAAVMTNKLQKYFA